MFFFNVKLSLTAYTMFLLVLLALSVCCIQTVSESAPCINIGSAVHCVDQRGKFLPKNNGDVHSVFITDSDMTELTNADFASYGNVKTVLIKNCVLGANSIILMDLWELEKLEITNCSLNDDLGTFFLHKPMLEELSLRGNKITRVTKDLVFHLQHLLFLDLSDNNISFVEDGAFDHMTNLQEVNLEGNTLREVAPDVVARAGDRCVICRTAAEARDGERAEGGELSSGQRPCTSREATRCAADRWLDRLWWRAPVLTLRLRGNPLCNATAHTKDAVETPEEESRNGDGVVPKCEVEVNKCLLHERRRLFLLEACGMEKDNDILQVSQPRDKKIAAADTSSFIFGSVSGIIITGLVVGIVVVCLKKRKTSFPVPEEPRDEEFSLIFQKTNSPVSEEPRDEEASTLNQQNYTNLSEKQNHASNSTEVSINTSKKMIQMIEAMLKGDHSSITEELKKNSKFPLTKDENGDTLLHHAARVGEVKLMDQLLSPGLNADVQNKLGQTPLYVAILHGNRAAAVQIIQKGPNLESGDVDGELPLNVAASKDYGQPIRLLLNTKDRVKSQRNEQGTYLYTASQEGHLEIVESLIEKGAKVDVRTSSGYVPLHAAAWNGHTNIVQKLISKMSTAGVKVDVSDIDGWTPLHSASRKGHNEIVKILLQSKADVNAKTNGGNTPLHKAAKGGHLETVEELLAHGADISSQNNDGKTAADIANENGHKECVRYMREQLNKPYFHLDTQRIN